ncbi:MAG: hypothetical protein ABII00_16700 [Elusimicrobiota bacterium]
MRDKRRSKIRRLRTEIDVLERTDDNLGLQLRRVARRGTPRRDAGLIEQRELVRRMVSELEERLLEISSL